MSDFELRLNIDAIRDGDRYDLVADDAERADIARRLDLRGLDRLEAHVALDRGAETITAKGRIQAALEQSCVVTGDAIAARVDEPFEILFVAEPEEIKPDDEIELSSRDCDVVFHDGGTIELGSAIADTLALAIDPYPRSAGADVALKEAGVLSEGEAGPFAALAKLKRGGGENAS